MPKAFLIGLLAARHRILDEPSRHLPLLRRVAVVGVSVGWAMGDWSFPSNHAAVAGAAAMAVFLVRSRWALIAVPLAAVEAFSRVFVGVHYPHDVVVGLLVGALVALVAVRVGLRPTGLAVTRLRTWSAVRPLLLATGYPSRRPSVRREHDDAA